VNRDAGGRRLRHEAPGYGMAFFGSGNVVYNMLVTE
jgi:hypothetical protein